MTFEHENGVKLSSWQLTFAGAAIALLTTIFMVGYTFATDRTAILAKLEALQNYDQEGRNRGDDIRRRLTDLESGRAATGDRLTRVEENLKLQTEMLREIRDELRKPTARR